MINFNKAEFISAAGTSSQLQISDKPEVIFSGRSNVGKSSLINKLVNRKSLARVSATPGKTATINFFDVDKFCLVDLPGYGYAKVSHSERDRWAELMEGYFAQDRNFCLVVQIVDMRHLPTQDDLNMIDFLYNSGFPFIIVLTKKDKLKKTAQKQSLERISEMLSEYEGIELFPFSALNGEGTDDIREIISQYVENFDSQG